MSLDFAGAHAARIHRDDLAIELGKAALVLGDQHRIKRDVAIARGGKDDLAAVGGDRLATAAIATACRLVLPVEGTSLPRS